MAAAGVHGKRTVIIVNGSDLSAFCKNSTWNRKLATHDNTTYGVDDEIWDAGLTSGSSVISGVYDTTTSGPHDVLQPLNDSGTKVTFTRRVEGTGSGLPQDSVDVLVEEYMETSAVNDYVQWSATLKHSGAVTSANQ